MGHFAARALLRSSSSSSSSASVFRDLRLDKGKETLSPSLAEEPSKPPLRSRNPGRPGTTQVPRTADGRARPRDAQVPAKAGRHYRIPIEISPPRPRSRFGFDAGRLAPCSESASSGQAQARRLRRRRAQEARGCIARTRSVTRTDPHRAPHACAMRRACFQTNRQG